MFPTSNLADSRASSSQKPTDKPLGCQAKGLPNVGIGYSSTFFGHLASLTYHCPNLSKHRLQVATFPNATLESYCIYDA